MNGEKALGDLEYIRNVMHMVRRRNAIDGIYYVILGAVIPICTALTWILAATGNENLIGFNWIIGMFIGGILCFVAGWRRGKRQENKSHGREAMMYLHSMDPFCSCQCHCDDCGVGI